MVTLTIDEKTRNILDLFTGRDYSEKLGNLAKEVIKSKIKNATG